MIQCSSIDLTVTEAVKKMPLQKEDSADDYK